MNGEASSAAPLKLSTFTYDAPMFSFACVAGSAAAAPQVAYDSEGNPVRYDRRAVSMVPPPHFFKVLYLFTRYSCSD